MSADSFSKHRPGPEGAKHPEAPLVIGLRRREFIAQSAALGAGVLLERTLPAQQPGNSALDVAAPVELEVKCQVNGAAQVLHLDPRVTLCDALREHLGLTGTKKGCDHGQCGSCTVLVNGRRINSCLSLAAVHDGDEITTIEGLSKDGELHPLQAAFIKHDGFQCGYCTPGQICSAHALLESESRSPSDEGIRELMSGNLCRCGAYNGILAAIKEVRDTRGA